jgi:hypothetical protein
MEDEDPAEAKRPLPKPRDDLPLVVTKNGVPFKDQDEGIRQFKEACLARPVKDCFPGTAGMFAERNSLAVSKEWRLGWNACLAEIDRLGGFTNTSEGLPK